MLQQVNSTLDRVLDGVQVGSLWFARAGGVMILLTVVLVTTEVASRVIMGRSAVHATELTGYITAISASWSFAYTLMCKAHIRIDALYLNFPTKVRGVLDLIALLAMAMFCILVVDAVFSVVSDSYSGGSTANTPLGTPLWMPQALWMLGLVWFGFAVCVMTLRALFGLLSGDVEGVQKLAGSPTLDELIADENRDSKS
ncbi:TRAP transporter small permease subunit [Marinobacter sp. HL-58]|uniref:TRAP transporter small permease subunit n=1 Tax=Marinobacter sp. HL-58 TaxID=1479237 RepID=UPI000480CDC1|nr:TRAP transporter small permease [Marinobacter sp. HL-58]KPP99998.1 MAG: TRAP-type transport system small permease component [Marinobacter sp. HL-58]